MIIVFITNKTITLDTILPILIESKKRRNQKIIIVVSRKNGLTVIENNVVLNDLINEIGFKFLLGGRYRAKWYKRSIGSIQFFCLFVAGIFGAKFIHFDTLQLLTIKILSIFFKKKVFYSERDSIETNLHLHPSHHLNKFGAKYTRTNFPVPLGGNYIGYNEGRLIYYYGSEIYNNRKVYLLGPTRQRRAWMEYIYKVTDYYFNKFHKGVDTSEGIIFLVLSYYGSNVTKEKQYGQKKLRDNFEKTIKILARNKGNIPVFLKPHNFTDVDYVKTIVSKYDGFHITYLHPSVLLQKTKFIVSNLYSTIFGDASSMGIPTLEFAYYPEYIKKDVGDESICPKYVDWFVYDDAEKFEKVSIKLINNKYISEKFVSKNEDNDNLIDKLC
jgi:hypothetical protein